MPIINFEVKKPLEQKIKDAIKNYGFSSKAEFFRFAAISFLSREKQKMNEEDKLKHLVFELRKTIIKNFQNKKMPSLKKQLTDV